MHEPQTLANVCTLLIITIEAKQMSYIKESLSKNEELLATFPLHWWAWLRVVIWCFIGVLTLPAIGVGILFLILAGYFALVNINEERGMTDKRVITKQGIISRNTGELRLNAIETVTIRQGIIGRILGFGQVRVTGRGLSDVAFNLVADPMNVKRKIEGVIPA
ncbi:MAG: PH domain-containing protein [Candidatus Thiothrix sulfatifontis]|nr:MAG: PH domain-containing protein [Candidatus Thiothrix sulfatifontis]